MVTIHTKRVSSARGTYASSHPTTHRLICLPAAAPAVQVVFVRNSLSSMAKRSMGDRTETKANARSYRRPFSVHNFMSLSFFFTRLLFRTKCTRNLALPDCDCRGKQYSVIEKMFKIILLFYDSISSLNCHATPRFFVILRRLLLS